MGRCFIFTKFRRNRILIWRFAQKFDFLCNSSFWKCRFSISGVILCFGDFQMTFCHLKSMTADGAVGPPARSWEPVSWFQPPGGWNRPPGGRSERPRVPIPQALPFLTRGMTFTTLFALDVVLGGDRFFCQDSELFPIIICPTDRVTH